MLSFWSIAWTLGIGGTIAAAAALFFFWPFLVGTKLGRTLLAIGAGAAAIFAVFLRGVSKGAGIEKRKAARRHARNLEIAKEESAASKDRTPSEARARMKGRRKK